MATSRMVTIQSFQVSFRLRALRYASAVTTTSFHPGRRCDRSPRPGLALQVNVGGHYSRVQALSRIGIVLVTVVSVNVAAKSWGTAPGFAQKTATGSGAAAAAASQDPAKVFAEGEDALGKGDLDGAERSFKRVLALNPRVAGAYANLGVIHMRRK
ncbi:MAG: hypothetical protein WA628_16310 [Terriglobales bacterium]